jgi:hypothetical protein
MPLFRVTVRPEAAQPAELLEADRMRVEGGDAWLVARADGLRDRAVPTHDDCVSHRPGVRGSSRWLGPGGGWARSSARSCSRRWASA